MLTENLNEALSMFVFGIIAPVGSKVKPEDFVPVSLVPG